MRIVGSLTSLCVGVMGLLLGPGQEAPAAALERSGVCVREGAKFVGMTPVRVGKGRAEPKKLRNTTPRYPELPLGTRGSGGWMGEFLLDPEGSVAQVWTIREVSFSPPFPPFNQAIVDAIKQWKFEPLIVRGKPVPVCTSVTVGINWS
jgi:TonB family protein